MARTDRFRLVNERLQNAGQSIEPHRPRAHPQWRQNRRNGVPDLDKFLLHGALYMIREVHHQKWVEPLEDV